MSAESIFPLLLNDVMRQNEHKGCLICNPKTTPVLVLHTEAKVLLLSENGTVGSDWSASYAY